MSEQAKKWSDDTYSIKIEIVKGKPMGDVYNQKTGKSWTLSQFIQDEREMPFPGEVSQNFHRILDELQINMYRDL